ncbi:MAG TPA: alpha-ketoglutarate-dependent dioxygenase AlkB [Oligoflexia bacterium]|nr:alpha-ketoglutarate-dependent dioxygenase AlkB [Oligoflexia bacterium]HMR24819.1 alpha-ketoglutarate-dependent dioxygenase AlkB [Oligoflexia bacterium]
MDLFEQLVGQPRNVLPYDGTVYYYGPIFAADHAQYYFDCLLKEVAWQYDQAVILGKTIVTKRKVAWYADQAFTYTYSKTTRTALPWLPILLELKTHVEKTSQANYNACLLNFYHDGQEGMNWHSDAEKELVTQAPIASLSFGAERKFSFKHKTSKEKRSCLLEAGSLLVMKDKTQSHWLHSLPATKTILKPRINLTFRLMHGYFGSL